MIEPSVIYLSHKISQRMPDGKGPKKKSAEKEKPEDEEMPEEMEDDKK